MKITLFKKIMGWLVLSSLLLTGACATAGYQASSTPQDPLYWQMWQDKYGGNSG